MGQFLQLRCEPTCPRKLSAARSSLEPPPGSRPALIMEVKVLHSVPDSMGWGYGHICALQPCQKVLRGQVLQAPPTQEMPRSSAKAGLAQPCHWPEREKTPCFLARTGPQKATYPAYFIFKATEVLGVCQGHSAS